MQNTKVLPTGETVHDFRPQKLGWGWNGLSFDRLDSKHANMLGIGKGLKEGHYVALKQSGVDYAYKVLAVNYESNPTDMFKATLLIWGDFEEGELD